MKEVVVFWKISFRCERKRPRERFVVVIPDQIESVSVLSETCRSFLVEAAADKVEAKADQAATAAAEKGQGNVAMFFLESSSISLTYFSYY